MLFMVDRTSILYIIRFERVLKIAIVFLSVLRLNISIFPSIDMLNHFKLYTNA